MTLATEMEALFEKLGAQPPLRQQDGLVVTAPATGEAIASLARDDAPGVSDKIHKTAQAQAAWATLSQGLREEFLRHLSTAVKIHREPLSQLITYEAGKTKKEALGEVDGSADILLKTIKDAAAAEAKRTADNKERLPVGVIGLITSFNFPLAVANWTIGPALLAGNGVVWKPSEKTPLTALGYKAVFDKAVKDFNAAKGKEIVPLGLLQIAVGERDVGEALVAHEKLDMVSATGSVGMGKGIKGTLAAKKNNRVKPILELGGNNAIVISNKCTPEHLEWALTAILNSVFGTGGQRCTNTRRLIVHENIYDIVIGKLKDKFRAFIASGVIRSPLVGESSEYGYGPLIDKDAFVLFQLRLQQAQAEGGTIVFGQRVMRDQYPEAYYVEPTLALMPTQTPLMHKETFAPLLFITPYSGAIDNAIEMVNAPANAGLVNGIYTQSQQEADRFAAGNQAGHTAINSPTGTGTPAHGMGFGGNKESGEGVILAPDPLASFTKNEAGESFAAEMLKELPGETDKEGKTKYALKTPKGDITRAVQHPTPMTWD